MGGGGGGGLEFGILLSLHKYKGQSSIHRANFKCTDTNIIMS